MNIQQQKEFEKNNLLLILNTAIAQARADTLADTAARFSSHLDGLIRSITVRELDRAEIVGLLTQESIRFHEAGLSRGLVV